MKSVLIGNGINIQYGGEDYYNNSIIKRAIKNVLENKFDKSTYKYEVLEWLDQSYNEGLRIIKDGYIKSKDIAWTDNQKKSLIKFFNVYKNMKLTKESIGFEYYFLLDALYCNRYKIRRTIEWDTNVRGQREEGLRRFFIDAIYNNGEINNIYLKFPDKLKEYLYNFDNIFTTNYDSNIEKSINKKVIYLHGAFHILDVKYDNTDIVNKELGTNIKINNVSKHLYSNAITNFSGEEKLEPLLRAKRIDDFFNYSSKMLEESKKKKIELENTLEKILKIASQNPNYTYPDRFKFKQISEIKDEIIILGLSPHNDNHIFEEIKNNININKIEYKYFSNEEAQFAKNYFNNKVINATSVKEFWDQMEKI